MLVFIFDTYLIEILRNFGSGNIPEIHMAASTQSKKPQRLNALNFAVNSPKSIWLFSTNLLVNVPKRSRKHQPCE